MARPRWSGFSKGHEVGEQPEKKGPRKAARTAQPKPKPKKSAEVTPPKPAPALPPMLSNEQRVALRQAQLQGRNPFATQGPLREDDPDMEFFPQDVYENQLAGRTVSPEVLGPQPRQKARVLPNDQDLTPYDPDLNRGASAAEFPVEEDIEELDLIAAVSAQDQTIIAVDNGITDLFTSVRNLRQAIETMDRSVQQGDEARGQPDSATEHSARMREILTTAVEPWVMEIEDHFNQLLNQTGEAQELISPADRE